MALVPKAVTGVRVVLVAVALSFLAAAQAVLAAMVVLVACLTPRAAPSATGG